jgi:exodeoxyribonuclease VII small subunit
MTDSDNKVAQFESALHDLEALVSRMESGELSLEESLRSYEQGIALFRQCQSALEAAQLRVRQLNDPSNPDLSTALPDRD